MDWAALRALAARFHLELAVPLALAIGLGVFGSRMLKRARRSAGAQLGEAVERTASRSLRLLAILIGLGWALSLLPPAPWAAPVGGALYVLTVLVAARLATRLAAVLIHAWLEHAAGPLRERAQKEYAPIAQTLTTVAVALVALIVVAHHFGHDVSSLVTALGIGSLAIGLAAQQTLGNMIAGFTLLVDRPFRPGDRIRLATGETGEVAEIGIRSTRIVLDDANLLIVPNAELANSRVQNYAFPTRGSRGEVRVKVAGAKLDQMLALLPGLAREVPEVLPDPPPEASVVGLDDGKAELAVRFHVLDQAVQRRIEERLRGAIAKRIAAGP
jgi:small-conductance mechanosensitive channel